MTPTASPNSHHVVGHGPHAVLVLHGWFGDAHAFAPMEPALTTDEFAYAFIDYRGYGGMRDVEGAYTIDEIASDTLMRYRNGQPLEHAEVRSAIANAEQRLGRQGRLIIRPSGTEPVIRVMGEGDDKILVEEVVDGIVDALNHVAA